MVVAEALAAGLPVLASARRRAGAARCRRRPGCWCRRATSPALQAALERLIAEPAPARATGRRRPGGGRRLPTWHDAGGALRRRAGRPGMTRRARAPPAGFSADWLQQREPFDAVARATAPRRACALDAALAALRPAPRHALARHRPGLRHRRQPALAGAAPGRRAAVAGGRPRRGTAAALASVAAGRRGPGCGCGERGHAGREGPLATSRCSFSGPGFDAAIVRRRLDLAHAAGRVCPGTPPTWSRPRRCSTWSVRPGCSGWWRPAPRPAWRLLFALSVDGRHRWTPRDRHDADVGALFAAHQRRDKGFGPALGAARRTGAAARRCAPPATACTARAATGGWTAARDAGTRCALQRAMVDGIAGAACEQDPAAAARVQALAAAAAGAGAACARCASATSTCWRCRRADDAGG